jgi:hypothetical protein
MSPLYTAEGVAVLATIVQAREVDPSGSRIHLTGRASAVSMKAGVCAPAFCFFHRAREASHAIRQNAQQTMRLCTVLEKMWMNRIGNC